ncbi:MAG: pimeloyl-ACP methyl ester esterase BioH [Gammaproteobacteria bacterium]|nr:pimeloyl-ACP methyl ester esterase BioH [Gammaproteobacteria bacterium]
MKSSRLSVTRSGCGDPLILLHGWGMNAAVFEPLCDELEKYKTLYRVDLPGYGASSWSALMSFQEQLDLIADSTPAGALLGWSMGGLYATELARQYAERFHELTLVCCNPCFVRRDNWDCAVEGSVLNAFARDLDKGWQYTVKRFLSLQMRGSENTRLLIRQMMLLLESRGEPNPEALQFGLNLLKNCDYRQLLGELNLPIKMILGERDLLAPHTLVKEIVHVNPRIQVESLADAAHAPFLSHTRQFLAMLLSDSIKA